MAQELVWNQFNAGWVPSDNVQNGRKNGLLQMDGVQLDEGGSLSLMGGAGTHALYTAEAYYLFAGILAGAEFVYAACTNGNIYKETTVIYTETAGSSNYLTTIANGLASILICTGTIRVKDNGNTFYNLGLSGENASITLSLATPNYTPLYTIDGTTITWVVTGGASGGTSSSTTSFSWTGLTVNTEYTFELTTGGTLPSLDWTTLPNGGGSTLTQEDTDQFNWGFEILLSGVSNYLYLGTVTLNIYSGSGSSNYFTYSPTISSDTLYSFNGACTRGDFTVGGGSPVWSNITKIQIIINGTTRSTEIDLLLIPLQFYNRPTGVYFGFYRGIHNEDTSQIINYIAQPVSVNSNYTAIMGAGSIVGDNFLTESITVPRGASVSIALVQSNDPQVTGIWIYREGADLPTYYQAQQLPNTTGTYVDDANDIDVLDTDLVLNLNLYSVQGTAQGLDKIWNIIGPMEGRWWYFASQFCYASDINDPDVIDITTGIRTASSENEVYLWAAKVAEGYIIVATSVDFYILSGTFQTLPDGILDVYYRPMVCKFPAISRQFTFANGLLYYMGADGWRSIGTTAESSTLIIATFTDLLYGNQNRYGYSKVVLNDGDIGQPGSPNFPITSTKNKLWCCVNDRIEVYDFVRQYWRTFNYQLGAATAITSSVFGLPIAGFADFTSRYIDNPSAGGTVEDGNNVLNTNKQQVSILSSTFDPNGGLNRNDLYTLKVRLITGQGENLSVGLILSSGVEYLIGTITAPVANSIPNEISLDINSVIPFPTETFQIHAYGNFSTLVISDFRILYDPRPKQQTSMRGYNTNFGSAGKVRLRSWPIVIDTLGNEVTFTPYVDNVKGTSQVFSTNEKTTVSIFYNYDAFGTDYGYLITGGPFEFWEAMKPEIVENTPAPKQYDQIGPQELFRYGKVKELEMRLFPLGTIGSNASLPVTIYFDDYNLFTYELTVNLGVDQVYNFGVPKGTSGSIFRVELGPVSYAFIRYSLRAKVMLHGQDTTDNARWVNL